VFVGHNLSPVVRDAVCIDAWAPDLAAVGCRPKNSMSAADHSSSEQQRKKKMQCDSRHVGLLAKALVKAHAHFYSSLHAKIMQFHT